MSQRMTAVRKELRRDKTYKANLFLRIVAQQGKQQEFVNPMDDRISMFILDERARVWFWDSGFKVRVFVTDADEWRNFSGNKAQGRLVLFLTRYCNGQVAMDAERLDEVLTGLQLTQDMTTQLLQSAKEIFEA